MFYKSISVTSSIIILSTVNSLLSNISIPMSFKYEGAEERDAVVVAMEPSIQNVL